MGSLLLPAIHVSILIGLLVYFLKSPFGRFVQERYRAVVDGLNKSKIQVAEAESKKREVEQKLASLNHEKAIIFGEWKERESAQIKSIVEGSQRVLSQMKIEADSNKRALEASAQKDIINKMGILVVEQATKRINEKLNSATHHKLNDKFSREL